VVRTQAFVVAEPHGYRLVAAVHRHERHVHVNEEIAFDGAAIERELLAMVGFANRDEVRAILGVVVVEPVGPVGIEHLVADHVANFVRLHAPVDARRDDDLDVLDAVVGQEFEQDVQDPLAHVGASHGRKRQRDVVHSDGDLHAGSKLRVERLGAERVVQRVADGGFRILQRLDRRFRIDDASSGREIDFDQSIAGKEGARGAVTLESYEAGMVHRGRGETGGVTR
jgi:hypothetical protein